MITGAPIRGVSTFIGSTEFSGRLHSRLHANAIVLPMSMVRGNNERCEPEGEIKRAMWGVARPMKVIGPQKAVLTADNKPVQSSNQWRV